MANPKILIIDIETIPNLGYFWRMWDENIGINQLVEPGRIWGVGWKWLGEKEATYVDAHIPSRRALMLKAIHKEWSRADAIVSYNGAAFDVPWLMGEFALFGLAPPPPVPHIDMIRTVKKFKLPSRKLAYVLPHFGCGEKVDTGGFDLWRAVMAGNKEARLAMGEYCLGDVVGLELLYIKLKSYVQPHPHLGPRGTCGTCGSTKVQRRGVRKTKAFVIQRLQCMDCGGWSDGTRTRIDKVEKA